MGKTIAAVFLCQSYLSLSKDFFLWGKKIKEDVKRRKKLIVALLLVIIFGILAVIKYHTFAIENINGGSRYAVIGEVCGVRQPIPAGKLL